jgi:hypothetical protein
MAVESATDLLCDVINGELDWLCVTLPGGGEYCFHNGTGHIPVSADICQGLLPQIQGALAVLAPMMCLIDVAVATIKFAEAVPDTIGPPPDPTALAEALADLLKAAACLLPLIPQLTICPLIKALLDIIINCLIDIRDQLTNIISLKAGVQEGRDRAAELGAALLNDMLDCAEGNIDLLEAALSGSTESMQRLIDITVNPLLQVAGLDPIEVDMGLGAGAPEEVIETLDTIIDTLIAIRDALPCELLTTPALPPE